MASCGVGGPGFGERLHTLEKEFEVYRARIETEEKWKEILEGWILHNFSFDIQRELLRRTQGDNNVPSIGEKTAMSAIEYNTVNVANSNNHHHHQHHQQHHNHGATVMLAGNSAANLLCNYCPPAAKRKKPNGGGGGGGGDSQIQVQIGNNSDGRHQMQQRTVVSTTGLGGTAVPISLTPVTVTNALIRQDARFNADDFDPVKIFGELTQGQLATSSGGVIGTTEGGFGATLLAAAGFNATSGGSNILDHTTRILSFASDGNRIEETLEIKRTAVAGKSFSGSSGTGVQVPNSRLEGQGSHSSAKKTGTKGKKNPKNSKPPPHPHNSSSSSSSDPSKSSGSSPKRKLKSMSIEEKYYVLQRLLKPDVSQATICEEMQLNKSVVSRIWCDRFKIEELYKQGSGNRIKVKYMHNGPAHPKKRGHGKKAKALAKQNKNNNSASNNSSNNNNNAATSTNTTANTSTPTTTSAYHQTLQNLQQPTFTRPTLLGLYAADTLNNLNVAGRSYEHNNSVQH